MPRQRLVLVRRTWISGLALALLMAGALLVGELFTGDPAVAAVSPGVTLRASVADDEAQGNGRSFGPSISADGRYVAFESYYAFDPLDATLEPSLLGDLDVYLRDTVAGTTTLISHGCGVIGPAVSALAQCVPQPGGGSSPSISADGRYIAFYTTSANIPIALSGTSPRVVVCDLDPDGDGTFASVCVHTVVSRPGSPVDANPRMSADATMLAYTSTPPLGSDDPPRLVLVTLNHGPTGIIPDFMDRVPPSTISLGSVTYEIRQIFGLALSAGGSHVGLIARYQQPGSLLALHVAYDYDVASNTFVRMDVDGSGNPLPEAIRDNVALSGDGRRFAFAEDSAGLGSIVRLYDRDPDGDNALWPVDETLIAETGSRNTAGDTVSGDMPAFSADGRYFAFVTDAVNVHNGVDDAIRTGSCVNPEPIVVEAYQVPDGEHRGVPVAAAATASAPPNTGMSYCDVVVRDLVVDRQRAAAGLPRLPAELASPSRQNTCLAFTPGATCEGGGDSVEPVLTANGSAVAYSSPAPDLVPQDTNNSDDVFVRRFTPTLGGNPVDFGAVEIGQSLSRAVPVRHVGFGPLTGGPVAIAGPDATDFAVFPSQNCTGAVLHATEQCVVSVRFRPTTTGARNAVLQVRQAGALRPVQIPLSGTGRQPPPGFRAAPNPLAFGARGVLTPSAAQAVTVTNTGRGPLRLTAVTLSGTAPTGFPGDYEITANTCLTAAVPPGGSCQVSVRHVPKAVGVRPAVLQFVEAADPPVEVVHRVDLTGTGLAPTIVANPPLSQPGQVTRVTGVNFPPGGAVRLVLDGMPGEVRVVVAGDGTFTTQFVILPHTSTGRRLLRAAVVAPFPAGLAGAVQASTQFLVVPGSLQPPGFIVRK